MINRIFPACMDFLDRINITILQMTGKERPKLVVSLVCRMELENQEQPWVEI